MARNHGLLLASIWSDPDWLALSASAQRAYALLLSQPKLSLVGLLTYTPSRWARLAADTDLDSIEAAIAELEASRFVIVDRHTDELLIRTLVRHDITTVLRNKNLLAGMWRAWEAIESRQLRQIAVEHIPASVWDSPRCQPHPEALQLRRSAQLELTVPTGSPDPQSELPSSLHPPPSNAVADSKQPGNSRGTAQRAAAVDNSRDQGVATHTDDDPLPAAAPGTPAETPEPVRTADERQQRLSEAIDLLVTRELQRNPSRTNPKRHASAVRIGKLRDHHQAGHGQLLANPTLTPAQLADLLEPPSAQTSPRSDPLDDPEWQQATRQRQEAGIAHARALAAQPADPQRNLAGIAEARQALGPPTPGAAT